MVRRWLACVVVLLGCERNRTEWPAKEVLAFQTSCPSSFADARFCSCFAPAVARRVPYDRVGPFLDARMRGPEFADIIDIMREETARCAAGRERDPWPASLRAQFIKGCLIKDEPLATCECLADFAEKTVPFAEYLTWSLEMKAGRPEPRALKALFIADESIACFTRNAPWSTKAVAQVVAECRAELEGTEEQCRCYAERMQKDVSMHDLYLLAAGRDGGAEVAARVEADFEKWWVPCVQREAKQ